MSYFHACDCIARGDRAAQIEYLDKALAEDPTEVDSLIAAFQLPGQTAERRAKIEGMVQKAVGHYRNQIVQSGRGPDTAKSAESLNQFAWLVANTKGDLDDALRCSKRSLELGPNRGAYLDTLAHVYFARGEYEDAVRNQTRAAELDPHSGLIARELARFRAAAEEHKKTKTAPAAKP